MTARTIALVACLALAAPARAGFITVTPLSYPAAPNLFVPVGDLPPGAVISSDRLVTDQYAPAGVRFDPVAVGLIGGVPAWLPTGSRLGPPGFPDYLGGQLNFQPGYNAVISGSFVAPATGGPMVVTVEFVGGEPGTAAAVFFDSRGSYLGNPTSFNPYYPGAVELPDGRAVLTFGPSTDISRFELYRTFTPTSDFESPAPWGIARIDAYTSDGPSPVGTPEPGTLALAATGLLAAGLRVRRRR